MDNNELLGKITELLDVRFQRVDERFDKVDERLEKVEVRLDKVEDRLEEVEVRLDKVEDRVEKMDKRLRKVELQTENDVVPRLQVIGGCYLDTYKRYQTGTEDMDTLKTDMEVVKKVVAEHSIKLKNIS